MTTKTKAQESRSKKDQAPNGSMAALEAAAETSDVYDVSAFAAAYRAIDWEARSADEMAQAVRLALNVGAPLAARERAMAGAERFPEHAELQKMARILAPPVARVVKGGPHPGIKADRDWLNENWDSYRGRWVALRDGQLLAVADSLDGLVEQVGEIRNSGILVTSIW